MAKNSVLRTTYAIFYLGWLRLGQISELILGLTLINNPAYSQNFACGFKITKVMLGLETIRIMRAIQRGFLPFVFAQIK